MGKGRGATGTTVAEQAAACTCPAGVRDPPAGALTTHDRSFDHTAASTGPAPVGSPFGRSSRVGWPDLDRISTYYWETWWGVGPAWSATAPPNGLHHEALALPVPRPRRWRCQCRNPGDLPARSIASRNSPHELYRGHIRCLRTTTHLQNVRGLLLPKPLGRRDDRRCVLTLRFGAQGICLDRMPHHACRFRIQPAQVKLSPSPSGLPGVFWCSWRNSRTLLGDIL